MTPFGRLLRITDWLVQVPAGSPRLTAPSTGAEAAGRAAYPHHGQWSAIEPLAMCGTVLRAWGKLVRG